MKPAILNVAIRYNYLTCPLSTRITSARHTVQVNEQATMEGHIAHKDGMKQHINSDI